MAREISSRFEFALALLDGSRPAKKDMASKMIAARRAGATIFLAPQDNCGDVRGATPRGLNVIKVGSLHDAVADLQATKDGKAVPHC